MTYDYNEWLKNGCPKIFCKCGCNQEIIVKIPLHKYENIPEYIKGHNSRGNTNISKRLDVRQKLHEKQIGRHPSEETLEKMRKPKSEEHKQKLREINLNKHLSEEHKQKIRESRLEFFGEKSPNWKGGITSLNIEIRNSNEYKEWRLQIFGRDNFTCRYCNNQEIYLEVHHIKPFNEIIKKYNITKIDEALNCEILWDLNNGITYCLECHKKLRKRGGLL